MMFDKQKTVCFTGHRVVPQQDRRMIYNKLCTVIECLCERGFTEFCCGGALGFDMIAAIAVLDVKRIYPAINLHMFIPCKGHHDRWSKLDKRKFDIVCANAASVEYMYEKFVRWCYHERNMRMVRESSVCIYYMTKCSGGTYYTVSKAVDSRLEMIDILK